MSQVGGDNTHSRGDSSGDETRVGGSQATPASSAGSVDRIEVRPMLHRDAQPPGDDAEAILSVQEVMDREERERQRLQQIPMSQRTNLTLGAGTTTTRGSTVVPLPSSIPQSQQRMPTHVGPGAAMNMDPHQAQFIWDAYNRQMSQQMWNAAAAYTNAQALGTVPTMISATTSSLTPHAQLATTWGQSFNMYDAASAGRITSARTTTGNITTVTSGQQRIPQPNASVPQPQAQSTSQQVPVVTQPGAQPPTSSNAAQRRQRGADVVDLTHDDSEWQEAPDIPPRSHQQRPSNDARYPLNNQETRWNFYEGYEQSPRGEQRRSYGNRDRYNNNNNSSSREQQRSNRPEAENTFYGNTFYEPRNGPIPAGDSFHATGNGATSAGGSFNASRNNTNGERNTMSGGYRSGTNHMPEPSGHPGGTARDHDTFGGGPNMEDMFARMERLITDRVNQQIAGLNLGQRGPAGDDRLPTFTDLSSYPDIDPADPRAHKGDLNSREYRIADFKGHASGSNSVAADCKAFLQDIVETGKHHNLTHKSCIRLISRHTLGEPKEIVSSEMRDPQCTLESIVRALELRYMQLVFPDNARSQMYQITRLPNEDLHSLKCRLSDRAQMACRQLPAEEKLIKEQTMVKERLLSLLTSTVRNILRERERMRRATGRQPYVLLELVEEAIAIESEQNDDLNNQRSATKSVSFPSIPKSSLYHEQKQPRLPSPPPQPEIEYKSPHQAPQHYATVSPWSYSDEEEWSNESTESDPERYAPVVLLTSPGKRGPQYRAVPLRRARNGDVLSVTSSSDRTSSSSDKVHDGPRRERFRDDTPGRGEMSRGRENAPNEGRWNRNFQRRDSQDRGRNWSNNWDRGRPDSRDRRDSGNWNRMDSRDRRRWQDDQPRDFYRDRFRSYSRDRNRREPRWQGNDNRFQERRNDRWNEYRSDSREPRREWRENRSDGPPFARDWSRDRPSRGWYGNNDGVNRDRWRSNSRENSNRWYNGRGDRSASRDRAPAALQNSPPMRRSGDYNNRYDDRDRYRNDRQFQNTRGFSQERDFRNRPPTPDSRNNYDNRRNSNEREGRARSFERQYTRERSRSGDREVRATAQSARVEEGSCLRCGRHQHETQNCPTYGTTPMADTYCYRCKKGAHLASYCKEEIAPNNQNDVKN